MYDMYRVVSFSIKSHVLKECKRRKQGEGDVNKWPVVMYEFVLLVVANKMDYHEYSLR